LFSLEGSQDDPITDITIRGLGFRGTRYTYLYDHGMPSGGDWALQRTAAIQIQGSEFVSVDSCLFDRLDGNGIILSAYNRNATLSKNEFRWTGDTAMASWGNTQAPGIPQVPLGMGWDGTNGDQPRFTEVSYNYVHELGIWEKQSSMWFQAKTAQTLLKGNIFFNGPRAGINFNDGFGGASELEENLLFNTCRESGDHGPFNSWDRQVYVTDVATGTASVIKAVDIIHNNFFLANYNSQEGIDNDDGSCYYSSYDNFLVYSGNGIKSDFGGHDNHHYSNIYAYTSGGCVALGNPQLEDHLDSFYDNYCVMENNGDYAVYPFTNLTLVPIMNNNQVFSPNGAATENGLPVSYWQTKGIDLGTTVNKNPPSSDVLNLAKQKLGL
jgi:hypothetical protein